MYFSFCIWKHSCEDLNNINKVTRLEDSLSFPEMPFMLTLNVLLEIKIIYCIVNLPNW